MNFFRGCSLSKELAMHPRRLLTLLHAHYKAQTIDGTEIAACIFRASVFHHPLPASPLSLSSSPPIVSTAFRMSSMMGSSTRMTTASTSWLSGQSAWFYKLCNTDLSDLRSSHAYLIRNLLSSILIMFITCFAIWNSCRYILARYGR